MLSATEAYEMRTAVDTAERQRKTKLLREAEDAYHEIQLGRGVRTLVDQNGERIEYQTANLPRLAAYIHQLKRELGLVSVGGPARVFF